MKAILTSSLGGSIKRDGMRIPTPLLGDNGLIEKIKEYWNDDAKILLISASPDEYERNDGIISCLKHSFPMSGLKVSQILMCDRRSEELIEQLNDMDVVLLLGGHVPTQNAFFKKLGLREKLQKYKGLVIAWSAGSMNCADIVYAAPEAPGEAVDPNYQRFIPGLGLTRINIFPHYQDIKEEILDGIRVMEEIVYPDSIGHEFLAMIDGSYIVIDDGETLYGEAYSIKDGQIKILCKNGEAIKLS